MKLKRDLQTILFDAAKVVGGVWGKAELARELEVAAQRIGPGPVERVLGDLGADAIRVPPPKDGPLHWAGDAMFNCPMCMQPVDTRVSATRHQIDGGVRITGVPCTQCQVSFTVDLTQARLAYELE